MRVVFLSDTHLGFDLPIRPRVQRHRRGERFFENLERVLDHATTTRADLVLHGGDLFFRSRVPPVVVDRVYQRLARFAEGGIPLGLIAGNHERSVLPPSLLLRHPNIHVFAQASTQLFALAGGTLAVTGVPFTGDRARLLDAARGAPPVEAHAHLLLAHEAFEGATVGPGNFTFRQRLDTVPLEALPEHFDAVLSGHIHRRQVLWRTRGDGSRQPIVFCGSIERTSYAEQGEPKCFAVIELGANRRLRFHELPAPPLPEPRPARYSAMRSRISTSTP
ncbi:MAG: metallophosphoesterase [Deltaproteobacteria bacterium]|nr:metallophosphoesterase [Deltaproteobacteria bacterium]